MPAIPKHRQPIIDAAVTLFRRQGYSATGLNDIVDESGAPKGSLYHYFPAGKSSIAVAAVGEAGRRVAETVAQLARETASAGELIRAHARLLAGWMRKSGFRDGCPITTVLLELAPADRGVTQTGREAYAARLAVFADKLVADGFPVERAERLAGLCVSAIQGALIQARVERSGAPIETAADELARMLDDAAGIPSEGATHSGGAKRRASRRVSKRVGAKPRPLRLRIAASEHEDKPGGREGAGPEPIEVDPAAAEKT